MKKIKYLLLIIVSIFLVGCTTKNVPFFEKQKGVLEKDYKKTFENPVYFYTQNESNEIADLGVEFTNNPLKITFSNWTMSKPDKEGYVEITFDSTYEVDIDLLSPRQSNRWYYNYHINSPLLYDYYTGEIYKMNSVSEDGTRFYQNGSLTEAKKEYKYTDVDFNGKKVKIGLYYTSSKRTYSGVEVLDKVGDKNHYKDHSKMTSKTYIRMPKDYRGVMLVVNKKGADKEMAEETFNNSKKYTELKNKYGEDSKEIKALEKESEKIRKLVDPNDDVRKKYKISDYYHIRVADVLDIKEAPSTNYTLIAIIAGSSVLLITLVIVLIVFIAKKNKKAKNKK